MLGAELSLVYTDGWATGLGFGNRWLGLPVALAELRMPDTAYTYTAARKAAA